MVSNNAKALLPTIRSRCISLPIGIPERSASLAWLRSGQVADAEDWLAFSGGAPLLAKEYAESDRGEQIAQLTKILRQGPGAKERLLAWPVSDREHVETLAEILQKWAFDQAYRSGTGAGRFFNFKGSGRPAAVSRTRAWVSFAREANRYRLAARHPLNPKLFAADLVGRMPSD